MSQIVPFGPRAGQLPNKHLIGRTHAYVTAERLNKVLFWGASDGGLDRCILGIVL
jgi:hypothetical protein